MQNLEEIIIHLPACSVCILVQSARNNLQYSKKKKRHVGGWLCASDFIRTLKHKCWKPEQSNERLQSRLQTHLKINEKNAGTRMHYIEIRKRDPLSAL